MVSRQQTINHPKALYDCTDAGAIAEATQNIRSTGHKKIPLGTNPGENQVQSAVHGGLLRESALQRCYSRA
jgi:hypothetical protein